MIRKAAEFVGSLKYEISHMDIDPKKVKKAGEITPKTMRIYKDYVVKFGEWCKISYGARHPADCLSHIQDYIDWLVSGADGKQRSASTIHSYAAGVCRWFGVPMSDYKMPKRVTANNTRSRGIKAVDSRTDATRAASPDLWDFASCVGIRREEYKHLRMDDLVTDESGYVCVRVRRGKGGKYQEQRILIDDVSFVSSYFDGSEDRVFSAREMRNKIDLHHHRALQAQRAYCYYLDRLEREPKYREQLTAEIKARWDRLCSKPWDPHEVEGYYWLRGANRQLAAKHGLPVRYDRLAVMAVSVFHLSHWRCGVAVANYLLAV